jgi:hypothetical protein
LRVHGSLHPMHFQKKMPYPSASAKDECGCNQDYNDERDKRKFLTHT